MLQGGGVPLLETLLPTAQAWVSSGPASEDCLGCQPRAAGGTQVECGYVSVQERLGPFPSFRAWL